MKLIKTCINVSNSQRVLVNVEEINLKIAQLKLQLSPLLTKIRRVKVLYMTLHPINHRIAILLALIQMIVLVGLVQAIPAVMTAAAAVISRGTTLLQ